MPYNPFDSEVLQLQLKIDSNNKKIDELDSSLAWYQQFDSEEAHQRIHESTRSITSASAQCTAIKQEMEYWQREISNLEPRTKPSINLVYWFSSERIVAKRMLQQAKLSNDKLMLEHQKHVIYIALQKQRANELQKDIERYIAFDELGTRAMLNGLKFEQEPLEQDFIRVCNRKEKLDLQIKPNMDELNRLELEHEDLQRKIRSADKFAKDLETAASSYDRAMIHAECQNELGDGSPNRVLARLSSSRPRLESDIAKNKTLIQRSVNFALWDIRKLVIDGNNLCYQNDQFIGLAALDALVPRLSEQFEVTLIFDSSIRRLVALNTPQIRARFTMATVHVVNRKINADDLILKCVDDEFTFVISNDRFAEYSTAYAVMAGHIITHEIVTDSVHILGLNIDVKFRLP